MLPRNTPSSRCHSVWPSRSQNPGVVRSPSGAKAIVILSRIIGKSYSIMHSRSSFDVIAQCHVADALVAMSHFTAVFSTLFHIHGRLTAASHRYRVVHATAISLHNLLDDSANITSENLHLRWRNPDYLHMRHTGLANKEMKEDAGLDMETPAFATVVTRMLMASLYP